MAQRDVNPMLSMFSQVEKFATGSGYKSKSRAWKTKKPDSVEERKGKRAAREKLRTKVINDQFLLQHSSLTSRLRLSDFKLSDLNSLTFKLSDFKSLAFTL